MRQGGMACLFTRWTMASAKDSIIPEFREKIDMLGVAQEYSVTANDITHASGSRIMFRGIKTSAGNQTAKLKSIQGLNVWVLDEAEEMPDEGTFDVIDLSIRDKRRRNLVILCLNPVHKRNWIYRRWFNDNVPSEFCGTIGDVTYIHTDYRHNMANLPESYKERIRQAKAGNPARFAHVWRGAWVNEVQGALWSYDMIADHRRDTSEIPDMVRIVVAIDPSVSSTGRQDEVGIVVAGKGIDGHYYVLADYSGRLSPAEWAKVAINAYDVHRADAIVGETNQGGDLVAANIHNMRKTVKFIPVHASRGKITRAEPIATLYSQGLVHHVGRFPEQESELMSYAGYESQASPGRLDATVWAITELSGIDQVASSKSMIAAAPNARR
jgi:predicted phage terminase large subunit-like protein